MTPEFEWTLDHCYFSATSFFLHILNNIFFFILILVKVLIILMYGFLMSISFILFILLIFLYMKLN